MKKLALALVCLVSVAFFSSCDPEEILSTEPTIAVMTGDGFITGTVENPQTISSADGIDWAYGFHVESNVNTKKELSNLKVTYTLNSEGGILSFDTIIDLTGKTSYDFSEKIFESKEIMLDLTVTAVVTDVDNQSNTAALAFKVDVPPMELEPVPFVWTREGSNEAEGLDFLGLKWTKNAKEVFAVIEPVEGAILYGFDDPTIWDKVTTDVELDALFSDGGAAQVIRDYRGVSAWASHEYDDVIATYYEGFYYLIHVTKGTVSTKGTNITIEGEWK